LTDLAEAINVSPRQMSRILLREFGMNFVTKLTEMRLQQVKYQLTHTEKSIHQISIDCGFPSYSYFSTCFRKNVGMTPSHYRQSADHTKLPE
ncbi:MAG: helix-turn-helix transcriptional regulator, partial [Clostridia bacterium]|nr:helix-turn-helix transcriptional regulator [Clostridia bacterium]